MTLPGFELLFSGVQSQLRSPQDAIVSAIHWSIVSAGFKLTGVGENAEVGRQCTESLQAGWNSGDIYVLHYVKAGSDPPQRFLLKILPVDGSLMLHFQKENEDNVHTLDLSVTEYSTEDLSSASTALRNIDRLNTRVRQSLLDPAMGGLFSAPADGEASNPNARKDKKNKKKSSLLVEEHRPQYQPAPAVPAWGGMGGMGGGMGGGMRDPFSVGRSDLDPLAGMMGPGFGGGGMIMDPRHSGGARFGPDPGGFGGFGGPSRGGGIHPSALPPGSVPPGARFDPVGPGGMRPGPDPDHEQPPSGYDDMFM